MHASITVKNGDVFTGVFFGANMENHEPAYILKMVQQIKAGNRGEANGVLDNSTSYIGRGDDYAMTFDTKEVANLAIEGIVFDGQQKLQNGGSPLAEFHDTYTNAFGRLFWGVPYRHRHFWKYNYA